MALDTICARLFDQAGKRPDQAAYFVKQDGEWQPTSWKEYGAEVRKATRALLAIGFEPGQTVCILGFNRPEWVVMDLAGMCAGGAPAGIYTTCSPEEVRYIAAHADAPVILVENAEQWRKLDTERGNLPSLKHVVLMRDGGDVASSREGAGDGPYRGSPEEFETRGWEEFLALGDDVPDAKVDERLEALEPDGLATLIYTSGTTGPPKGVMLSHQNLAWTADKARDLIGGTPEDSALSYLPLSHIAEQMFTIHGALTSGYPVYFAESIDKVPDNLKEVQPRVFFGVPRIWEKFHAGVSGKLGQATGVKKWLAGWAMEVGHRVHAGRQEGQEPGGWLGFQYGLADKLIYSKVKPAIGLGNARVCVSGAAPISREVLEFFTGLDIVVLEVYGQSEDTGPTTFNRPDRFKLGTVGPALEGVEVKIADDGEILVKGPNVFLGYYKEEAATAETLKDGWLYSGDLGAFDEKGFLNITGRKKDIIITAGGKNVTPKNIEGSLKNHFLINEAVVIGDRRKYLSALVTLDPEALAKFAEGGDSNGTPAHETKAVLDEIQKAVDETNTHFARVEQIKKFKVLPRNLTIEDGELTPTLKVKRNVVNEKYADQIAGFYAQSITARA